MRIYKAKKKPLVFCWAAVALFYGLGIALDVSLLRSRAHPGVQAWIAFAVLQVLVFAVPVLLTFALVAATRQSLTFEPDYFEFFPGGRKRHRVYARDIVGFSYDSGPLKVYFWRRTPLGIAQDKLRAEAAAVQEEPAAQASGAATRELTVTDGNREVAVLTIGISDFEKGELFLEWLSEHVPEYIDGQAWKDIQHIESGKYGGLSAGTKRALLARATQYARWLNVGGVLVALWVALFPRPLLLSVIAAIAYPLVLLVALHRSDGWIHFDKRGNSIYPCAILAQIAPAAGLPFHCLFAYEPTGPWRTLLLTALAVAAAYLVLFCLAQKEYSFREAYTYLALALFSMTFLFYGMGVALSVNCDFDRSEPHLEKITAGGEEHTVWLHDGLLGTHWYYNGQYHDD